MASENKILTSKFRFPSLQTADDPSPQAPLPMLKSTITGAASTSLSAHKKTKGRGFCEGDADLHSRLASRDFESLGTDDGPGPQRCTSKAEPYKIGERTTDIMLEILNLDKKEVVSINGISNQEFTEDSHSMSKKHLSNSLGSSSQNSESSDTQELDLELRLSL
ncbi:hypothetical protein V6Z12_D07G261900 [Gossypium hirsutum]